jgi:hypothetical protein
VQRDDVVAFLDRGKPCVDVGALGLESLDVGGERGRIDAGVCTENLSSGVVVVKPAKDGV